MIWRSAFALFISLWWPQSVHSHGYEASGSWEPRSYSDGVQERLSAVAFRVLVANAEFCGHDITWTLGIRTSIFYPGEDWSLAEENDAYPTVVSMIAGSPAGESGLRVGDRILAFNDEYLLPGQLGENLLSHLLHENQERVLQLAVDRNGAKEQITLHPRRACSYDVLLFENDEENALAQGNHVLLTTGMLDFLTRDDDVAVVLAHEVAHIAAGHTTYGADQRVQAVEPEADYFGIYFAARAGYDVSGAADLLQRIASLRGGYDGHGRAAGIDNRLQAIRAAVTEVEAQRAAGKPLNPPARQFLRRDRVSDSVLD
jgi:predicted Zn-dependent protease